MNPNNRQTAYDAATLGLILSSPGRYSEGKPLMQGALDMWGASGHTGADYTLGLFKFACAAAVGGQTDEAIRYSQSAIQTGLPPTARPELDDDLKLLRSDARFIAIVQNLQKRAQQPPPQASSPQTRDARSK